MRKNSPRKWIHAILDLLPVILIPVFMVYSHRHTLTENTTVDIQYKYQSNEVNNYDDLKEDYVYFLPYLEITGQDIYNLGYGFSFNVLSCTDFYYEIDNYFVDDIYVHGYDSSNANYIHFNFFDEYSGFLYISNARGYSSIYFEEGFYFEFNDVNFVYNVDLYDFLQNKTYLPTISDFNVIDSVDVQDTNSDIMSVFTNDLSKTIDKYFNMNQVFNLHDVWSWINTNMFGGNAPLVANVIWNVIVYEFVVDLLFLFYAFFMFLIDFTENLLDKPFNKGR